MKTAIIYTSKHGTTAKVAQTIAEREITGEMIGISSKGENMAWKSGYSLLPTFRTLRLISRFSADRIHYLQN
jgi:hypothetical protein